MSEDYGASGTYVFEEIFLRIFAPLNQLPGKCLFIPVWACANCNTFALETDSSTMVRCNRLRDREQILLIRLGHGEDWSLTQKISTYCLLRPPVSSMVTFFEEPIQAVRSRCSITRSPSSLKPCRHQNIGYITDRGSKQLVQL